MDPVLDVCVREPSLPHRALANDEIALAGVVAAEGVQRGPEGVQRGSIGGPEGETRVEYRPHFVPEHLTHVPEPLTHVPDTIEGPEGSEGEGPVDLEDGRVLDLRRLGACLEAEGALLEAHQVYATDARLVSSQQRVQLMLCSLGAL